MTPQNRNVVISIKRVIKGVLTIIGFIIAGWGGIKEQIVWELN